MKHKFKISTLLMILFIIIGVVYIRPMGVCGADETPDVEIRLAEEAEFTDTSISVVLEIGFDNLEYYNEHVYLSYHIFDCENNMVIGENERIKIDLNEEQSQRISVKIDMSAAKALEPSKKLYVEFDIVDEQNAYWFSGNDSLSFQSDSVSFDSTIMQKIVTEIQSSKIIFAINAVAFVMLCSVVGVYYYRNRKCSMRSNNR